jgi:APA family basic amino acid/polyamine antiporter
MIAAFGLALIPILWTYGGWHENIFVAEETRDAARIIPSALIIGLCVVTVLYLAINFLYIYLIPIKDMVGVQLIGAHILDILFGTYGRKIFEAVVIISSLACINAMIITGSRITYAMAKDNAIFRYLAEVNARYQTPHCAVIANGLWSVLLVVFGTFNMLLFFTGGIIWFFFALTGGSLFVLRYKFPLLQRPYKVWGFPFVPAVFILICLYLFINTAVFYPFPLLAGLLLLGSGIPVYIFSQKMKKKPTL